MADPEIRATGGRAPDVFSRAGWTPMAEYPEDEPVDFLIIGTGAGGGPLAFKLAQAGMSVVALEAGPYWRPLSDFASDETAQSDLFWTEPRLSGGDDPIAFGANNSGRGVGGTTLHFTMVSLRFRPEWFRAWSSLGYGVDWPISWAEIEPYYREVEQTLRIAGPVKYPWPSRKGPYPLRAHEVGASGLVLADGAEKLGIDWTPTPLATLSAPHGKAQPCAYRGFCKFGCSTNAKQSVLVTWIPRALKAGAEIRDQATATRIETGADGRVTGVVYRRDGEWRRQKCRNVAVCGYAIETPRLLLNSATPRFPDGLANSSGLVGRNLMPHANQGVWGVMPHEVRFYKGPPGLALTEHWNYHDEGKDFHGGYAVLSAGILPIDWARTVAAERGLWGQPLLDAMSLYNLQGGLKIVGEIEAQESNRVELAGEVDALGVPIPSITFGFSDNDRRLQRHAIGSMTRLMEAVGAEDLWSEDDTAHLMGTCRMGDDPATSVVDADGRSWDIPNLWICDGSLFPTSGGVNPSLTIQALACRIGDRIVAMNRRGEL